MMDRSSAQPSTSSTGATKSASSPLNKSGIADQIEVLRSDMSGLAAKITGITKEQLSTTLSDVETVATDKTNDLKTSIRSSPMQAVAVSVGIGFVLGLVLSR